MNRLEVSDQAFLARHNFNADVPLSFHPDTVQEQSTLISIHLEKFLREQYKKSFTTLEMSEYTGVPREICYEFLMGRERSDVKPTLKTKDGKIERWKSLAKPYPATREGLQEEARLEAKTRDELGRGARADFLWTTTRGKKKRRQHTRAVTHF